jgi:hypothetical protein
LGIVASVLWALGGGLFTRYQLANETREASNTTVNACLRTQWVDPTKPMLEQTSSGYLNDNEGLKAYQASMANSWQTVAIAALGPILIGWLLAYMFIGVWRWVKRSFSKEETCTSQVSERTFRFVSMARLALCSR